MLVFCCSLLDFIVFHVTRCSDQHLSLSQAGAGEGVWRLLCRLQKLELPSQQVRLEFDLMFPILQYDLCILIN